MKATSTSFLAFVFILGISLSSCKRDVEVTPNTQSVRPANFEELDAPSSFDWETNKSILISLTGYATSAPNEQGVITIMDENENVLYRGFHSPQLTFEQELLVPQALKTVRVKFGVTDKLIQINTNTVSGTLLPVLPDVN